VWSAQVGDGFSAVAVANGRLYTMGNRNNRDIVTCLDAKTGRQIWTYSYACGAGDYNGPRATPVVDGTVVYSFSREGHAVALSAADGKLIWNRDLVRLAGATPPRWGFAGSPLVDSGRIIYNAAGGGIALDGGGRVAWKSGGTAGYATPVPFTAGNRRGVAIFSEGGLVAVDPTSGRRLWHHPWDTQFGVNAADPVFAGDTVFISSNYNRGGALLRIGGARPAVLWENRNMRNHFSASVRVGGYIYGNDENTLKCIDARSGEERWRNRGIGKGGLIAADGKLLVLTERGELTVVQATPQRYVELASAQVLQGRCWTHPVLANGLVYCRSHEGRLVCLDLKP
jgi:outer membrane protein assembly factor BamB